MFNGILAPFWSWFSNAFCKFVYRNAKEIGITVAWISFFVWDWWTYLCEIFLGEEGFVWKFFTQALEAALSLKESVPSLKDMALEHQDSIGFTMRLVGRLNQFFPVMEFAVLFGIFFLFLCVYILVKWILKLIPGMGG